MWFLWAVIDGPLPGRWAENQAADRATLARMARGEHDALAGLYDRHARPIYSLALRILHDDADAEDIVQQVFSQAWIQASRYDVSRGPVSVRVDLTSKNGAQPTPLSSWFRRLLAGAMVLLGAAATLGSSTGLAQRAPVAGAAAPLAAPHPTALSDPPILSVPIVDLWGTYDPNTRRLGSLNCNYVFATDPNDRWCFSAFGSTNIPGKVGASWDYKVAAGSRVYAATAGLVVRIEGETSPLYPGEFELETRAGAGAPFAVIYDHVKNLTVNLGSTVAPGDVLGTVGIHTTNPSVYGRVELQINQITQTTPVIISNPICPEPFGTAQFNQLNDAARLAHNSANPAYAASSLCATNLPAPVNLRASVSGLTVQLTWDAASGGSPLTSYLLEAGSASGRSDLATIDTGFSVHGYTANGVPEGTYFVRVRSKSGGSLGPPSNEVMVVVGRAAGGTTLFDDFGPGDSYQNGFASFFPGSGLAYGFTGGTSDSRLDRVEVALVIPPSSTGLPPAQVQLLIADEAGAILETLQVTVAGRFGDANPPLVARSILQPLISTNRQYWLVAIHLGDLPSSSAGWNANSTNSRGRRATRAANGTWTVNTASSELGAFRVVGR